MALSPKYNIQRTGKAAVSGRENTDPGIKGLTHTSAGVLRNLMPDGFPQIYTPNYLSRSKA